jgi:hypothetical protein
VNSTPITPPAAHTPKLCQNGNPCQCPTITSAGSTKITEDKVPAAEACVCTMLFSRILPPPSSRSTAMEITAAGMELAKVSPTFRPR